MPTNVSGYRTRGGKTVRSYSRGGNLAMRHVGVRNRLASRIEGMTDLSGRGLRYRGGGGQEINVFKGPWGNLAPSGSKYAVRVGGKQRYHKTAKAAARHVYRAKRSGGVRKARASDAHFGRAVSDLKKLGWSNEQATAAVLANLQMVAQTQQD